MAKSKRDHFEEELRALQQDILGLSQKLAIPLPPSIQANASFGGMSHSQLLEKEALNHSGYHSEHFRTTTAGTKDGQLARLRKQLHEVTRDRDDLAFKLKQAEKENETMARALKELNGLKSSYDSLKEDYEGIKLSLESSERIRRQQKELIGMLRQSQASTDRGPQTSFISQRSDGLAAFGTTSLAGGSVSSLNKKDVSFASESALSTRRDDPFARFALHAPPADEPLFVQREQRQNRPKKAKRPSSATVKSSKIMASSARQEPVTRRAAAVPTRSTKKTPNQRADTSRVSMVRRTGKPPTRPARKTTAAQSRPSSSRSTHRGNAANVSFRSARPASASSRLMNTSFMTAPPAGRVHAHSEFEQSPRFGLFQRDLVGIPTARRFSR